MLQWRQYVQFLLNESAYSLFGSTHTALGSFTNDGASNIIILRNMIIYVGLVDTAIFEHAKTEFFESALDSLLLIRDS